MAGHENGFDSVLGFIRDHSLPLGDLYFPSCASERLNLVYLTHPNNCKY
jgi:hypothetical protein